VYATLAVAGTSLQATDRHVDNQGFS